MPKLLGSRLLGEMLLGTAVGAQKRPSESPQTALERAGRHST